MILVDWINNYVLSKCLLKLKRLCMYCFVILKPDICIIVKELYKRRMNLSKIMFVSK